MYLNRYGLVDPDLVNLVEMDERLRRLAREAETDPEARERLRRELIRLGPEHHDDLIAAGFSGDVMAHLVREHASAMRDYNNLREKGVPLKDAETAIPRTQRRYHELRQAIRRHYNEHGDHPADHVKREEGETPRQFANRLIDFNLATGTVRQAGERSSPDYHGSLSYDNYADEDKDEHYRKRDAMASAWEREVPEGHADTGDRTRGNGEVKGSYVHFNTGARPRR